MRKTEKQMQAILQNYNVRRHLLQNMHLPSYSYAGPRFVYMKNHKAACSNVLSFLVAHLHHAMKRQGVPEITMESLHNPSPDYLRAGARSLDWDTAKDALLGPDWYRFTVIREPLSRTVSAWADKLDSSKNLAQRHRLMAHLKRDNDADLTLSDFLHILATDEIARDLDRHWRPQHKEISFSLVDYDLIGRVEEMDDFRNTIAHALFGEAHERRDVVDTRKQLGHKTGSKSFLESLTAVDRRNAERAFELDFEMYETVRQEGALHP